MSRKRREDYDDGSSKFEWGGGLKGEKPVKEEGDSKPSASGSNDPKDGDAKKQKKAPKMKLEPSGLLREEALKDESGVVRKYVASDDSAMPTVPYSLYPFKVALSFFFFLLKSMPGQRRS